MENLIEVNPKIMVGKPVIKGTRITVELILEKLAAGQSFETILSDFPHLSREKVSSAVRFAMERLRQDFPPQTENQRLLASIDAAYADEIDSDERTQIRLMKRKTNEALDEWK